MSVLTNTLLPHALPDDPDQRVQLIALRRMAAFGLHDARASLMLLERHGMDWRRKLVLLRAFVNELAQCSQRRIKLAPCCVGRMTSDEARIVEVLDTAQREPHRAATALRALTAGPVIGGPLSLAAMLAR